MDFLKEATKILCEGTNDSSSDVHLILEDAESPVTKKTIENLYQSVIDKGHIDFDDIPKSKGNIVNYSGYKTMIQVLSNLSDLTKNDLSYQDIARYVKIIQKAIENLQANSVLYTQAFAKKNEVIMIEYNTFVFTCVEAITSLLYQFADFMKTPSAHELKVSLKNTKYRADMFYVEQLESFNRVCASGNYKKYLSTVISSGKENFFGADDALLVGSLAVITTVALSIVPVTRKLVYTFQDMRNRIADDLELQAYYLELNKAAVEANDAKTADQKKKILDKQEKIRVNFLRKAEKLRVKSVHAEQLASKAISNDNRTMTIDTMRNQVDNDDFSIV